LVMSGWNSRRITQGAGTARMLALPYGSVKERPA
jgi:hypothetical protein